jgi:hypothetical protein
MDNVHDDAGCLVSVESSGGASLLVANLRRAQTQGPMLSKLLGFVSRSVCLCWFSCLLSTGCLSEPDTALGNEADGASTQPTKAVFPLHVSSNGRYLTDSKDTPFLIKEISAWGLIQTLPEADAAQLMDSVKAKGFNTLLVSAISYDQRFAGSPPAWQSISPFSTRWDFSTPDSEYFAHVDRVLKLAESKGLLVLLVPCYLGYPGDPTQGWAAALEDPTNSPAKSREYGRFLGRRYKSFANIVWVAGGDNSATGPLHEHMLNIIEGIREVDKHLWTGHFDASSGHVWSTDNTDLAKYMNLDGLYAWTEAELGDRGPQYKAELAQYKKGKLIFQLDQSYESDVPYYSDNMDPQWIRRKNYDGLLSGCAGTSFSPGVMGNQLYTFRDWRPLMSTQGMQEAQHAFRLFESRAWQTLVPDTNQSVVVAGRGNYGEVDYVCAARTDQADTIIAYLPTRRTITVDMTKISGSAAIAWWFEPTTGVATRIGSFDTKATRSFTPPKDGDWVLVLDAASKSLPAPGSRALSAAGPC